MTLRDHLVGSHFLVGNALVTATRDQLSPRHPLRRFLKPFTYRTVAVNRGATALLVGDMSLLHRAVALRAGALAAAFNATAYGVREVFNPLGRGILTADEPPVDFGEGPTPFAKDYARFRGVVSRLCHAYVSLHYHSDTEAVEDAQLRAFWRDIAAFFPRLPGRLSDLTPIGVRRGLADTLTSLIVHVTAVHKHVGSAAEYVRDPRYVSGKVRPGAVAADVQSAVQALSIALVTGLPQPKLTDDFSHLLLRDVHFSASRLAFDRFQRELLALAKSVGRRNRYRRFKVNSFNPSRLASSVSI